MGAHPVSLIIVSRHRIAALQRAVTAIGQQDHPAVELIVVADPKACDALAGLGLRAKIIPFDQANIAVARNLGLTRAAGQVVAFIDDDAVPEPTWLSRLVAPFVDPMVVAATGFVRGRNGISFQWRACEVDACGFDHPLDVGDTVSLHAGNQQRAVKTHGTNCAFRRDALLAAGGFDAGFRFYLDEADVNLRMASAGLTAVVPLAQVHHGFAASARRRADRVPLSLYEIGASSMVFLRRHAAKMDWPAACARLRTEQRHRLLRLMVSGGIEPRDLPRLMQTLDAGLIDGALRALVTLPPLAAGPDAFLPLSGTGPRDGVAIAGRPWQRAGCEAKARAAVAAGQIATVFILGPTARFHRHGFHRDGYWLQSGGLFGRAGRREPLMRICGFSPRIKQEIRRIAGLRPVSEAD